MNKKSFVLYCDYREHIKLLSVEDKAKLLDAIFAYASGEEVELDGAVGMAFSFITAQMDRDTAKWETKCEKLRANGSKGGLAKAKNAKQMLAKASKTKQGLAIVADNVTDNVNVNVNENVNVKEKKSAYGEYAHVKLTKTEYQKMISDFGQDKTDKAIKFFDEYIEDKGYKSKSHNLAMRRWVFKAVEEQEHKQGVANGRGNNITISAPNSRQRADYEEVDKLLWG